MDLKITATRVHLKGKAPVDSIGAYKIKADRRENCPLLSASVDLADRLSNPLKQLYTVSQQVMREVGM